MARRDLRAEHRRRWFIWTVLGVVIAVTLVVGGPWFYARFLAPEPPPPLELTSPTEEIPTVPTGPVEIDGTWLVQTGSEAGYRLGEVLSGEQLTVVGRTEEVTGTVAIDGGVLTEALITVDVGTISSDDSARDAYFRRALDTTSFPDATFELTEAVDVASIGLSDDPLTVTALGLLTLHGESQEVTATLDVQRPPEGVEVACQISVALRDFNLEAPDLGWVVVDEAGTVEALLLLGR
jgi:polyisoprenoid-binding protein YceI